jgi:methionine biosynthesis protein MetW
MADINGRRPLRQDLRIIADMIAPGARALDVGCGDGALLHTLLAEKGVDGRGIELSAAGVNACVSAGLSVIQGDADTDLKDYPSGGFDYVILSQTLQATRAPREVLSELLRIAKHAVVSFPNFGHWRVRLSLLFGGRMPPIDIGHHAWYDTPNIHFCTIKDFLVLCDEMGITVERSLAVSKGGRPKLIGAGAAFHNLFGEQAVFLLSKG